MNDLTKGTTMNDPEWVQENDWTKAQPGDTVRLTNNDGAEVTIIIRDRRDPFAKNTPQWVASRTGTTYVARDWRLFVQAPPAAHVHEYLIRDKWSRAECVYCTASVQVVFAQPAHVHSWRYKPGRPYGTCACGSGTWVGTPEL